MVKETAVYIYLFIRQVEVMLSVLRQRKRA